MIYVEFFAHGFSGKVFPWMLLESLRGIWIVEQQTSTPSTPPPGETKIRFNPAVVIRSTATDGLPAIWIMFSKNYRLLWQYILHAESHQKCCCSQIALLLLEVQDARNLFTLFSYRTFINTLAILPQLGKKFIQSRNTTYKIESKK